MIRFTNGGSRLLAIPPHGGSVDIKPGIERDIDVREGWLTEERKAMLKGYGVTMKPVGVKAKPVKSEARQQLEMKALRAGLAHPDFAKKSDDELAQMIRDQAAKAEIVAEIAERPHVDEMDAAALIAELEAAGVDVDGRWGRETLAEKVMEARNANHSESK